ncbi:MAG: hypothetical protein O3B76_09355 [Proteobacteria bacterium]|nr:hypothetical protein [Pseudomonadota bacterium]
MRKEMIALVAAAFILGVGTATFLPVAAFAAEDKKVSACDKIKDAKKKAKCTKDEAAAMKKMKKK